MVILRSEDIRPIAVLKKSCFAGVTDSKSKQNHERNSANIVPFFDIRLFTIVDNNQIFYRSPNFSRASWMVKLLKRF